jgi:DNA polymerase-3 subunit delta'
MNFATPAGHDTMVSMKTSTLFSAWPVIGHNWAVDLLRHAVTEGHPTHALLIVGLPNVGKGTLARSFVQALLCPEDRPPCGACRTCQLVTASTHPDLRWIEPQDGSLKIDQVRELTRQLALAPVEGPWQIAVLDRFETATPGAANALLKTLEEPPPTVILVLLAQQAEALLSTIVSRCQIIALRPIPRSLIQQALTEQWKVEAEQARLLSHLCSGRLGWAVSAATSPALLEQRKQKLDDLVNLLHNNRVTRFAYAESLARQAMESILESLELWSSWWRDVLLLSSQSLVRLTNEDRRPELVQTAAVCDIATAQAALSALRTASDQLSRNANARLALEVLLLDLPLLP